MTIKLSADSFLSVLRRSGLMDDAQIDAQLKAFEEAGVDLSKSSEIADALVRSGRLSHWQAEKLLKGKHKGFFLGKYRLHSLLGKGGMSSVYLAEHVLMRRRCAIKVLPAKRVKQTSYLERFHREAQAVAALDHPNIVRAYDVDREVDKDHEIHYLVMEYVDGRELQELVDSQGPLSCHRTARYIQQAARGLHHAHKAGLVHRDIKPSNLLIDQQDVVKILDLGLARLFNEDDSASLTMAHDEVVLGTADYLAPEQAVDSHKVDPRADIYSLGCTFYFALTGHPPFQEGTLTQRLLAHQHDAPPPIEDERKDVPEDLLVIIYKMMEKSPEDRFSSAEDVARLLTKWLQEHQGEEDESEGGQPPSDLSFTSKSLEAAIAALKRVNETSIDEDDDSQLLEDSSAGIISLDIPSSSSVGISLDDSRTDFVTLDRNPPQESPPVARPLSAPATADTAQMKSSVVRKRQATAKREAERATQRAAEQQPDKPRERNSDRPATPPAIDATEHALPADGPDQSGLSDIPLFDSGSSNVLESTISLDQRLGAENRQETFRQTPRPGSDIPVAKPVTPGNDRPSDSTKVPEQPKSTSAATAATPDGAQRPSFGFVVDDAAAGTHYGTRRTRRRPSWTLSRRTLLAIAGGLVTVLAITAAAIFWPDKTPPPTHDDAGGPTLQEVLTVGPDGDFQSITEALAFVREHFFDQWPVQVVRVAEGTYRGQIELVDDPLDPLPQGLHLIAEGDVTLTAEGTNPVLVIAGIQDFVMSGFHVDAEGRDTAVRISGVVPGTRIEDLTIRNFHSVGVLCDKTYGFRAGERQLEFRGLRVEGQSNEAVGMRFQMEDGVPADTRVLDCRLIGPLGAGIELSNYLQEVSIEKCIFADGETGIHITGQEPILDNVHLINNSFFRLGNGIVLEAMPPAGTGQLTMHTNLFSRIRGAELVCRSGFDAASFQSLLQRGGNALHNWTDSRTVQENAVDLFAKGRLGVPDFDFRSTNPTNEAFLAPSESSPQREIAAPSAAARSYVGAVGPSP